MIACVLFIEAIEQRDRGGKARGAQIQKLCLRWFSKEDMRGEKKLHWRVDYLMRESEIERIFLSEKEECKVAKAFLPFGYVPGFGCSDCSCRSHLFYSEDLGELEAVLPEKYLYYTQHNKNE